MDSFVNLMSPLTRVNLPKHIAIIMDGNGRWAKARGLHRVEGHARGVKVSEDIIEVAHDVGIGYLTLYAFSKENWQRPPEEIHALMGLLKAFLLEKKQKMLDKGIRFNTIGDILKLPQDVQETIAMVKKETAHGEKMMLTLALSYGSRDEIIRAVRAMFSAGLETSSVNEEILASFLDTALMPDPDLIIRTSGESRISNFLLWQGAYAEFIFEECLWPDFDQHHFMAAIAEYQKRERRYGKTSEQLM